MADSFVRIPDSGVSTGSQIRTITKSMTAGTINEHVYIYGGLTVKAASATTASVRYYGEAAPGTASATTAWRIMRVDETSGLPVVEWANGTDEFSNVWDSRVSYTYT